MRNQHNDIPYNTTLVKELLVSKDLQADFSICQTKRKIMIELRSDKREENDKGVLQPSSES